MDTRLVTVALVAMLAAASAPAFIGHGEPFRDAGIAAAGDPRVGDCSPRCALRIE